MGCCCIEEEKKKKKKCGFRYFRFSDENIFRYFCNSFEISCIMYWPLPENDTGENSTIIIFGNTLLFTTS
jgi:hypothetical protein